MSPFVGIVLAATFTLYPGSAAPDTRIEAVTDRGPILEMIIRCPVGIAIITYSRAERLYCSPDLACDRDMDAIVARSCR